MAAQENINVLLVDDQSDNLLFLEAILQSPDYRLVKARSGKEALKYLVNGTAAVILLDLEMPDLDGFETATQIKERGRSRHTPIIFLTAVPLSPDQTLKAYSVGAVDILPKSVNPGILKSKVSVFVDLYRKSRDRWLALKGRADALAIDNMQLYQKAKKETADRKETEKRWAAQHRVTRVLAEAGNLNEATPRILQTVCEGFGWEMGALWLRYRETRQLRCVTTWYE